VWATVGPATAAEATFLAMVRVERDEPEGQRPTARRRHRALVVDEVEADDRRFTWMEMEIS
jgi:hypothetical protein